MAAVELHTSVKAQHRVYLKLADFIVCNLYINKEDEREGGWGRNSEEKRDRTREGKEGATSVSRKQSRFSKNSLQAPLCRPAL